MARTRPPDLDPLVEPPTHHWIGVAAGLSIIAAITALDAVWGAERILIGTVFIGAIVTALVASAEQTAAVGVVAFVLGAVSGTWNENFGEIDYFVRLGAIAVGSAAAVVGAEARRRAAEGRRRFALLAAIADVADGTGTLDETARRAVALIVPAFADVCLVDATRFGAVERLAVRAAGPDGDATERWLMARPPAGVDVEIGSRHAIEAGRAQLIERADPAAMAQLATDPEDAERIRALGARSTMTVPLRARGRTLGALSLSVTGLSRRRYDAEDARFAEVLAGRVALALDNAGLFSELETMEAQLSAALGSLTDTVTIQDRRGRLVYANEAAARDLGFASPRELLATSPTEIISHYDVLMEDGRPLELDMLPGRRVLAGEEPPPLVLRSIHRETGVERWTVTKATAVRDARGRPRLAVNIVEDITEVKRAEMAQRLLARASDALASSLDYEQTLQQVTDLVVPELADWCAVSLPDGHGYLRQVAVAHSDPDKVRFAREISARYPVHEDEPQGSAEVLRSGVPQVVNDIGPEMLRAGAKDAEHHDLLAGLGMRAAMIVPLLVGGRAIGTLALVSAESGRVFGDADVTLATELGRRAGTAVENARLYSERSEIAATLSESLLPQPLPEIPGWRTATLYRAAGRANLVGGDFYDAVAVRDGWLVLVGDVAGRGAPAARLTALARHTLRALVPVCADPLDALRRLNAELNGRDGTALCTVAWAHVRGDSATIVCAGHPQPLLVSGGSVSPVGRFGPMVGAFEDPHWTPVTVGLAPGDVLVLFTDGVLDTVGTQERFGEERTAAAVAPATGAADAVGRLERALAAFQHREQSDDTAVVALERAR